MRVLLIVRLSVQRSAFRVGLGLAHDELESLHEKPESKIQNGRECPNHSSNYALLGCLIPVGSGKNRRGDQHGHGEGGERSKVFFTGFSNDAILRQAQHPPIF